MDLYLLPSSTHSVLRTSDLMTARLAPRTCPWAELPLDLLGDVSGHLHDVADFIRFHAVCRSWRDALLSPATRPMFLPRILTTCNGQTMRSVVNFWRVRSEEVTPSYLRRSCDDVVISMPPNAPPTRGRRNWVASADGRTVWFFTLWPRPRLVDHLTGAVALLPCFPDDYEIKHSMEDPHGIFYSDGTVFLYSFGWEDITHLLSTPTLRTAIMRPGDTAWTFMKVRLYDPGCRHPEIGYHQGNVLVHRDVYSSQLFTPDFEANGNDVCNSRLVLPCDTIEDSNYWCRYSYLLESCGRLLSVSVLVNRNWRQYYDDDNPPPHAFLLRVHVLEGVNRGDNMRWEVRDSRSLADRVLFLGIPASFSADSVQLGVAGACAYFVFRHKVFMYNLINDDFKLVERMDPEWGIERVYVWLWPEPTIARIEEIKERLQPLNKGINK